MKSTIEWFKNIAEQQGFHVAMRVLEEEFWKTQLHKSNGKMARDLKLNESTVRTKLEKFGLRFFTQKQREEGERMFGRSIFDAVETA